MEQIFIYPDTATADAPGKPRSTPVHLGINETTRTFVGLALPPALGADPFFLRIAMSGAALTLHPRFELTAYDVPHAGGVTYLDPTVHISSSTGANIKDKSGLVVAAAHFMPRFAHGALFYDNNVYLLKITIFHEARLRIRIANWTETARDVVWVAADTEAGSRQPWIQVTPSSMSFDLLTGQTDTRPITVFNSGTGDLVVQGPDSSSDRSCAADDRPQCGSEPVGATRRDRRDGRHPDRPAAPGQLRSRTIRRRRSQQRDSCSASVCALRPRA
jgi:hypothetical protein